jgi:hypothetical protein
MLGTGSAIAAADPESGTQSSTQSSDSAATHDSTATHDTENRGSANKVRKVKPIPASEVGNHLAEVLRKTINDVTRILSTGRTASEQTPGEAVTIPKTDPADSGGTNGNNNSSATDTTTTPAGGTTTPVSEPTTPSTQPPAAAPGPVVPPAMTTLTIGPVVLIVTPVVDVITSVQDMLTSVVDYAAAPMSSDLSSLLGVTQWQPVSNVRTDAPAPPVGSSGMALTPLSFATPAPEYVAANTGPSGMPAETSIGVATSGNIDSTGTGLESTTPAQTPQVHAVTAPMTLQQFFKYAVDEVLRSPSLSALAAFALPGLIGLIIILGAGMRFGYRQAKAALALPASGLTRFARPQPLRLVRSRSSAAVSRPALRFVPTKLSAVDCPLENAA